TGDEKITEDLARDISTRENIRGILSCSIANVGQQYALTARLIDPHTGLAVGSYMELAKDQDHILEALGSGSARVRHGRGESMLATTKNDRPLPLVTTNSLQALKMYADAASLWNTGKYSDSERLFLSAIQLDPNFAMAHAALGDAYYSHLYNNPN